MNISFARTLYYGSYLALVTLGVNSWWIYESGWSSLNAAVLAIHVFFLYMRFWEPYHIKIQHHKVENLPHKIAFFSDPHLGAFKKADFLEKIIKKLNHHDPDLVLIGGDFVHATREEDLEDLFRPLQKITCPLHVVLGNHDLPIEGENFTDEVYQALKNLKISVIDDQVIHHEDMQIVGLKDCWNGKLRTDLLPVGAEYHSARAEQCSAPTKTIILTHNPDRVLEFPANTQSDLILCGHTHGGQIRLPGIYKHMIPCQHDFDTGWHEVNGHKVFVSPGVGEHTLPLRLGVRPRVHIFTA